MRSSTSTATFIGYGSLTGIIQGTNQTTTETASTAVKVVNAKVTSAGACIGAGGEGATFSGKAYQKLYVVFTTFSVVLAVFASETASKATISTGNTPSATLASITLKKKTMKEMNACMSER
jgi:hypothetical protein